MLKLIITLVIIGSSVLSNAQVDSLNFLKVGDIAPSFITKSITGDTIDLSKLTLKGKVILVFYRGAWCPYCNKHMSHLQDSLSLIEAKGVTVIAVSPEVEESIEKTIKKSNVSFSVVHDEKYSIMLKYGVAFTVDEKTLSKYRLYGINIEEANGNSDNILPVPATLIIGESGIIEYIHFDTDYKNRLSVNEILKRIE